MKYKLDSDELDLMREWLVSDTYKLLLSRVLPEFDKLFLQRLSTTPLDEKELLIARARIDGAREVIKLLTGLKPQLMAKQGDE